MNKKSPRVSIGMPVFNGEKYIEEAIDSILAQTFSDYELIISDNASTDRTMEICQAYAQKDGRIRYFRNAKNLGAAPNYNRAFELSSGEYFKWADYDDLLAPDFLAKCVDVLDQDPEVALCFPLARIIDENREVLGDYQYKSDTSSLKPIERFESLILKPDTAFQISGLMRARVVGQTLLHQSFPASDLVFLAELALRGKFVEIPEPLFYPRHHPLQSARVIPVERNRVSFFDTSYEGKITLPKWQYLYAYVKTVKRAPLTVAERSYCYLQIVRWMVIPDHFRALGKDMIIAGNRWIGRTLIRTRAGATQL